jgi:hypothetical protein
LHRHVELRADRLGDPARGNRFLGLILRAFSESEVNERLTSDPWTTNGLLVTKQISPWQLRLGTLG